MNICLLSLAISPVEHFCLEFLPVSVICWYRLFTNGSYTGNIHIYPMEFTAENVELVCIMLFIYAGKFQYSIIYVCQHKSGYIL